MAFKLNVIYPRGGGGSWLANLIWHLETKNFYSTQVEKVFDGQSQSTQVRLMHGIEFDTDPPRVYHELWNPHILFSSQQPFNHYLLIATKVQYHLQKIHLHLTRFQQFCLLTDTAMFVMTDELYRQYFYRTPDLHYHDIFDDPVSFKKSLYDVLDRYQIIYDKNDQFVLESISNYCKTCDDPRKYVGNVDSLIWLGFCHALIMIDDLSLNNVVLDDNNFVNTLTLFNDHCVERSRDLIHFYD